MMLDYLFDVERHPCTSRPSPHFSAAPTLAMGGLIADERRAANKKRILHISLGFIIGLLVGGIGVGWLAQWANGTDWRDVGGSLIRGPR